MLKINLLPKDVLLNQKKRIVKYMVSEFLVILIIGLTVLITLRFLTYNNIKKEILYNKGNLNKLNPIVEKVDKIAHTKKSLEIRYNVINELIDNSILYPILLEDLAASLPHNIWFTGIYTAISNTTICSLDISGISYDNYSIADFIYNLENNNNFSNVELSYIQNIKLSQEQLLQFKITGDYKLNNKES